MKLSMWMIANRLAFMDLEVHIRDRAPQVLKSARLAYATDCVTVMQNGNDVVCIYEDDQIRLKNISLYESFELVQGVFDFYQDWLDSVETKLKKYDYQGVIDACWPVFHNPIVLLNGQKKAIALSSQYQGTDVDPEWEYLTTHHYASTLSVREFNKLHHGQEKGIPQYMQASGHAKYSCLSCPIIFNHDFCGRISLIERDRPLNYGDRQLLSILAQCLKLPLAEQHRQDNESNLDWFSLLLNNPSVPDISRMFSYLDWNKRELYLLHNIILMGNTDEDLYYIVCEALRNHLLGSVVLLKQKQILVLSNLSIVSIGDIKKRITEVLDRIPAYIAVSLPYEEISDTYYAKKQVEYLHQRSKKIPFLSEHSVSLNFPDYAIDYMLESQSLSDSFHAVHPGIKQLWERKCNKNEKEYDLFAVYLKNDRSFVKASEELFLHRNTLVYHIKKILDLMQIDPDDTETIDYIKVSIHVLNIWEKLHSQ